MAASTKRMLLACSLLLATALAAPVTEDDAQTAQTQISEYYGGADSTSCYYNYEQYSEGDRIITNEPCLNCTCHNRMLMCYLRVCPFTKAVGQDCTIEKRPDLCCPVITCPEVPVQLLTSSTTAAPSTVQSTAVDHPDSFGCVFDDGSFFPDGAQVPSDPKNPCELCYCIRNRTACVLQECTLNVDGCKPVHQNGVCCPVRYDCDHDRTSTTTEPSGLLLTTTQSPQQCQYNGEAFNDGELISLLKSESNSCERCYCMRGEIVCAVQNCGNPMEGKDCEPILPPPEGQCCPTTYLCANETVPIESLSQISTVQPERLSTEETVYDREAEKTTVEAIGQPVPSKEAAEADDVPAPVADDVPAPVEDDVPTPVADDVPAPVADDVPAPVADDVPAEVLITETAPPKLEEQETADSEQASSQVIPENEIVNPPKSPLPSLVPTTEKETEKPAHEEGTTENSNTPIKAEGEIISEQPSENSSNEELPATTQISIDEKPAAPEIVTDITTTLKPVIETYTADSEPSLPFDLEQPAENPHPIEIDEPEVGTEEASTEEPPKHDSSPNQSENAHVTEIPSQPLASDSPDTQTEAEEMPVQTTDSGINVPHGVESDEVELEGTPVSPENINAEDVPQPETNLEHDHTENDKPAESENDTAPPTVSTVNPETVESISEEGPEVPKEEGTTETVTASEISEEKPSHPELQVPSVSNIIPEGAESDDIEHEEDDLEIVQPEVVEEEHNAPSVTESNKEAEANIAEESSPTTVQPEKTTVVGSEQTVPKEQDNTGVVSDNIEENLSFANENVASSEKPAEEMTTIVSIKNAEESQTSSSVDGNAAPLNPEPETVHKEEEKTNEPVADNEISHSHHQPLVPFDEVKEDQTAAPTTEPNVIDKATIPGEGSCLVDGQTYPDGEKVPTSSSCHTECTCHSSIVQCHMMECPPPPSYLTNCTPIPQGEDACCPVYSCDDKKTHPTLESQSQIGGTTASSEEENNKQPEENASLASEIVDEITTASVENVDIQKPESPIEAVSEGSEPTSTSSANIPDAVPEHEKNQPEKTPISPGVIAPLVPDEIEHDAVGEEHIATTTITMPAEQEADPQNPTEAQVVEISGSSPAPQEDDKPAVEHDAEEPHPYNVEHENVTPEVQAQTEASPIHEDEKSPIEITTSAQELTQETTAQTQQEPEKVETEQDGTSNQDVPVEHDPIEPIEANQNTPEEVPEASESPSAPTTVPSKHEEFEIPESTTLVEALESQPITTESASQSPNLESEEAETNPQSVPETSEESDHVVTSFPDEHEITTDRPKEESVEFVQTTISTHIQPHIQVDDKNKVDESTVTEEQASEQPQHGQSQPNIPSILSAASGIVEHDSPSHQEETQPETSTTHEESVSVPEENKAEIDQSISVEQTTAKEIITEAPVDQHAEQTTEAESELHIETTPGTQTHDEAAVPEEINIPDETEKPQEATEKPSVDEEPVEITEGSVIQPEAVEPTTHAETETNKLSDTYEEPAHPLEETVPIEHHTTEAAHPEEHNAEHAESETEPNSEIVSEDLHPVVELVTENDETAASTILPVQIPEVHTQAPASEHEETMPHVEESQPQVELETRPPVEESLEGQEPPTIQDLHSESIGESSESTTAKISSESSMEGGDEQHPEVSSEEEEKPSHHVEEPEDHKEPAEEEPNLVDKPEEIPELYTSSSMPAIPVELTTQHNPSYMQPPMPDILYPSPVDQFPHLPMAGWTQKPFQPESSPETPHMPEEEPFQPSGGESEYEEEEESPFGPGTCRYGGKVFVSAQQVPRDNPCDFCFCFRSDIICLQQSCPPPIHNCRQESIQGFCCPRYECPVSMATTLNLTTTTTTTTTTLPPHFFSHAYRGAARRTGCQVQGHAYRVGDEITSASGPCLHCLCGANGQMQCDPKVCSPEPMLRKMIEEASVRRRR